MSLRVELKKGATFEDLQHICRPAGLTARRTSKGEYIVYITPRRRYRIDQSAAIARLRAEYYLANCPVAVDYARFYLKRYNSHLELNDFLYKTFLLDEKNGNPFADFLKSLSFYESVKGKMIPFMDKIPYLDYIPK